MHITGTLTISEINGRYKVPKWLSVGDTFRVHLNSSWCIDRCKSRELDESPEDIAQMCRYEIRVLADSDRDDGVGVVLMPIRDGGDYLYGTLQADTPIPKKGADDFAEFASFYLGGSPNESGDEGPMKDPMIGRILYAKPFKG